MNKRFLINDFKKNKLVTIATVVFMALSAMMLSISVLLFGSLVNSIDRLMITAGTPDFLQMHAGSINEKELMAFAQSNPFVEKMQIAEFLNLENGKLSINNHSLSESTQDNGLCVQNQSFDYLMDLEGNIIEPSKDEVYVPVCYKNEYDVNVGDDFFVAGETLKVAGFLRDSQMNSMMASSKRFLVSEQDYKNLEKLGEKEYLIEFKLVENADVNTFSTEYAKALLPGNGPTITYSLIKLMNALSDGMMIFVILLASLVLLLISILCIRYILLTSMEKDKKEIGMLKAVGISYKDIEKLYLSKFFILSVVGALIGEIVALIVSVPLSKQMQDLYGCPENMMFIYIFSVIGTILVEIIILMSVRKTLKRMRKLSIMEALYGEGRLGKRKNQYFFITIISAATVALMLIPQNMAATLGSPKFVTYMGIGDSQIRMDIRQTEDIEKTTDKIINELEQDNRKSGYVVMSTGSYDGKLSDGRTYKLLIENGNHAKYPVSYSEGSYPTNANEIALSKLNAQELGVKLGDELTIDGKELRICGIYSDITNGGKTAKACLNSSSSQVMWNIIYINLKEEYQIADWVTEYQEKISDIGKGIKVTDISEYVDSTYGQTIKRIKMAAVLSMFVAAVILFVVVLLFIRLIIWQERGDCSLKKAFGFVSADIRIEYMRKAFIFIFIGIMCGIFIGVIPGEALAAKMLGTLGASEFKFIINPLWVFVITPLFSAIVALAATRISLMEIGRIKAYECCVGRE